MVLTSEFLLASDPGPRAPGAVYRRYAYMTSVSLGGHLSQRNVGSIYRVTPVVGHHGGLATKSPHLTS